MSESKGGITSFSSLMEAFLSERSGKAENTVLANRSDLTKLRAFGEKAGADSPVWMDEEFLQAFIASLKEEGAGERSIARMISTLHRFFRFLERKKIIPRDYSEILYTKRDAEGGAEPAEKTIPDTRQVLAAARKEAEDKKYLRDACAVSLIAGCGILPEELSALRVKDVDFLFRELFIQGEGEKKRKIPIPEETERIVHAYLEENRETFSGRDDILFRNPQKSPLTRQSIWKIVTAFGKREGIPATPRDLRRAFEVFLGETGRSPEEISVLLGVRYRKGR